MRKGKYSKGVGFSKQEILDGLRVSQKDMVEIRKYARKKGVTDEERINKLNGYMDEVHYLDDAHNFSYHAFLVGFLLFTGQGLLKMIIIS